MPVALAMSESAWSQVARLDPAHVTTVLTDILPLVGVALGAGITGGFSWSGGERQRKKEHLAVRKATYSACATALMAHYTALQSIKTDASTLVGEGSLTSGRFNELSALYTSVMQGVGAVMVEGPSQTARFAEQAALALEDSATKLRRWIESGAREEESVDLGSTDGQVKSFMQSARHSLRHPPHDDETDKAPDEPAKVN